jgi:hypothetical protein
VPTINKAANAQKQDLRFIDSPHEVMDFQNPDISPLPAGVERQNGAATDQSAIEDDVW